jgi:signal transduction histidine kinase
MTPDQIDKVFEPFVSYRSDGIGLGLSIVNQILKVHRAKIEVTSNLNRGTTFTLKFPCMENHEEDHIQSTHR